MIFESGYRVRLLKYVNFKGKTEYEGFKQLIKRKGLSLPAFGRYPQGIKGAS